MSKLKLQYLFILFVFVFIGNSKGQKTIVDAALIENWSRVSNGKINDDGTFVMYVAERKNSDWKMLTIKSVKDRWEKSWTFRSSNIQTQFINKGESMAFLYGDTLRVYNVQTQAQRYVPDVSSFRITNINDRSILFYQTSNKTLHFADLNLEDKKSFANVNHYIFSKKGNLLIYTSVKKGLNVLSTYNLTTAEERQVYAFNASDTVQEISASDDATELGIFLTSGDVLVFRPFDSIHRREFRIKDILDTNRFSNLKIEQMVGFVNGGKIVIKCSRKLNKAQWGENLKVWRFDDMYSSSRSLSDTDDETIISVDLVNKSVLIITEPEEYCQWNEKILSLGSFIVYPYNYDKLSNILSYNWNKNFKEGTFLISTISGSRKYFPLYRGDFSPSGNYLYGQKAGNSIKISPGTSDIFCYNIRNSDSLNLSRLIPTYALDTVYDYPTYGIKPVNIQVLGWSEDDKNVYLSDGFDVWSVEPATSYIRCLTNGYGRRAHIRFRPIKFDEVKFYNKRRELVFYATEENTGHNGFFKVDLNTYCDPQALSMGKYSITGFLMDVVKAVKNEVYLLPVGNASRSPNYVVTSDFRNFRQISRIYPEQGYNWITVERIMYTLSDGRTSSALLYKPDDFDKNKKYPVIFTIYEKMTDRQNEFVQPQYSTGPLNIPWFVSRGYLVVTPDIYYEEGKPGISALKSIEGARKRVTRFPFVDSTKIGLHGHSFGAFETNYIITHSNIFNAASVAAGISDVVAGYNRDFTNAGPAQGLYETWQSRIGHTLWERPDLYIDNSPILNADSIHIPVLIMHGKDDWNVPFSHGKAMFYALRRLQKPGWLLEYSNAGHTLLDDDAKDYTLRITQFFDHYLKNYPMPDWMKGPTVE